MWMPTPEARGGFTDTTKGVRPAGTLPRAAFGQTVPEDKRTALFGVLKNDPRPAYQHDPDRVYALDFGRFTVDGAVLTVTEILLKFHNADTLTTNKLYCKTA